MEFRSLAYIDIQHDALAVLDDVEQGIVASEDIWVSGYRGGSPSVHGKAKVSQAEGGGIELKSRDGVVIKQISRTAFSVSIPSLGLIDVPIRFPRQIIRDKQSGPSGSSRGDRHVNAISLSSSSSNLAIGAADGYAVVVPTSSNDLSKGVELKGHVGDVLDLHYFPSGEVILTASSDLSIRIWSAKDGSNPRTLKGHIRGVTSLGIIGVGKQIISGSHDGTIRLWDVGSAKEVRKWETEGRKAVQKLLIVDSPSALAELGYEEQERIILAATQTGLEILTWTKPQQTTQETDTRRLEWGLGSNLVSMAYSPISHILATGHANGAISLRHLSDLGKTILTRRNESPVYSLYFDGEDLYVGTAAGLPCRLGVSISGGVIDVHVREELAGWEAVGVETWAGRGKDGIWCAGGEGGIRRY